MDRGPHRPGTAGENPCHPRVAGGFAARTGSPEQKRRCGRLAGGPPPGTPHVRAGAQRRVSRRARPVNIPAEVPANGTHCERWSWRHGSDAVAIRFRASLAARNAPLRMGIRAAILRSSAEEAVHGSQGLRLVASRDVVVIVIETRDCVPRTGYATTMRCSAPGSRTCVAPRPPPHIRSRRDPADPCQTRPDAAQAP